MPRFTGEENRTHGQYATPLYKVWSSMKARCSNYKDKSYCNYGGRGIGVCGEWMKFEPFQDWATSSGYKKGLTLERKDNNAGYSPENCKWIPKGEQSSNTRRCKVITFQGETHNMKEWARRLDIPYGRLQQRMYHGWDPQKALEVPFIKPRLRHLVSGKSLMRRRVQETTGIATYIAASAALCPAYEERK